MKVLSLDISTKSTGYSVWINNKLVEHGCFGSSDCDFIERAKQMTEGVSLLSQHTGKFDVVVIEELKVLTNQKTLVMLAIVQGMFIKTLEHSSVVFVKPTEWRKFFSIKGKRKEMKRQALDICEYLGIDVANDDEAEAILLGRYYLNSKVFT